MKRGLAFALAASLCACAPAPVEMSAARASEVLNLFAAGAGPADICSRDGRAVLRAAVQTYAREMRQSGVSWPVIPSDAGETENVTSVDISVMIAFAAGFVKANDFQYAARGALTHLTILQWPEIQSMRNASDTACTDVQALQQAASHFVLEQSRLAQMAHSAHLRHRSGQEAGRLQRQAVMVRRAEARMQDMAAAVEARMRSAGV